MANARLEWTPARGSSQSYTLPVNFTWDYQELAQDETDRERALDGTMRSYLRGGGAVGRRVSPDPGTGGVGLGIRPGEPGRRPGRLVLAFGRSPGFRRHIS